MPVQVPVSADPSAVVAAFDRIRDAIRRTGQDAKTFQQLDLSHPELAKFSRDFALMQNNFEQITRMRRGPDAAAMRTIGAGAPGGQGSFMDWMNRGSQYFTTPGDYQRHLRNVSPLLFAGTSFAGGLRGGGGGGGGAGLAPRPSATSMMELGVSGFRNMSFQAAGAVGRFVPQAAWAMLGLAGVAGVGAMAAQGVGSARNENQGNDQLFRTLRDLSTNFEDLRENVRKASDGLYLSYMDMQRLTLQFSQLATGLTATQATQGTRFLAGVARSLGVDPARVAVSGGRAAYLGLDVRQFVGTGIEVARETQQVGREPEVLETLARAVEMNSRLLVTQTGLGPYAAMYAALGSGTDEVGRPLPGMRGPGAAALLDQANSAIAAGGQAGMAGNVFLSRAFSAAGITDVMEQKYWWTQGAFAQPMGENGPYNFQLVEAEANRMYPGAQFDAKGRHTNAAGALMAEGMGNFMGMSPARWEQWHRAIGQFSQAEITRLRNLPGADLTQINPTALGQLAEIEHAKTPNDLQNLAQRIVANQGDQMTPEEKTKLQKDTGDTLRNDLIEITKRLGMEKTEATKQMEAEVGLTNALDRLGSLLVGPLSEIAKDLTAIINLFGMKPFPKPGPVIEPRTAWGEVYGPNGWQTAPPERGGPVSLPEGLRHPEEDWSWMMPGGGAPPGPEHGWVYRNTAAAWNWITGQGGTQGASGAAAIAPSPISAGAAARFQQQQGMLAGAAQRHGLDPLDFSTFALLESRFKPGEVNSSGAAGEFQFVGSTAAHYGLTGADIFNPAANAEAAAHYAQDNTPVLAAAGIPATGENLYLAHQQGAHGLIDIMRAAQDGSPVTPTVRQNMDANLPTYLRGASPVEFLKYWYDTYRKGRAALVAVAAGGSGRGTIPGLPSGAGGMPPPLAGFPGIIAPAAAAPAPPPTVPRTLPDIVPPAPPPVRIPTGNFVPLPAGAHLPMTDPLNAQTPDPQSPTHTTITGAIDPLHVMVHLPDGRTQEHFLPVTVTPAAVPSGQPLQGAPSPTAPPVPSVPLPGNRFRASPPPPPPPTPRAPSVPPPVPPPG